MDTKKGGRKAPLMAGFVVSPVDYSSRNLMVRL